MSPKQQEQPSKIIMLAPIAIVLAVYSFAFYSPQQSKVRSAQARFDSLSATQHDTEHEIADVQGESSRLRKELRDVQSELDESQDEHDRLLAQRNEMRQQLDLPSRPAATMQRVTSLIENHRLQVIESQPESGSSQSSQ